MTIHISQVFPTRVFLHNHGVFDSDCNEKCGWYEIGRQLTTYDPEAKKQRDAH